MFNIFGFPLFPQFGVVPLGPLVPIIHLPIYSYDAAIDSYPYDGNLPIFMKDDV